MKILKSASKIVFVLITIAMIYFTYLGIIEAQDFVSISMLVFGFYFANKGNSNEEYLGK